MNKKITTKAKKLIANIPMKFAKISANTTCTWLVTDKGTVLLSVYLDLQSIEKIMEI